MKVETLYGPEESVYLHGKSKDAGKPVKLRKLRAVNTGGRKVLLAGKSSRYNPNIGKDK